MRAGTASMEEKHHIGNCKEVFELLSQYLDAELAPEMCAEIRAHIEGCPPCVEFVESLRKSVDICREYQTAVVPGPLADSARQELKAAFEKMVAARREAESKDS
jgi:anti-sigma factor RsiW